MFFVSFISCVLQDFKFYMGANDDFDFGFDFEQTNQFELFLQAYT